MQNYYQFIVPRLNGAGIKKDFDAYLSLVKKGIGGFIVFGGEIEQVRKYIRKLQDEAATPLIIASDLERGAGQQFVGGTPLPPAMALANTVRNPGSEESSEKPVNRGLSRLRKAFHILAEEAKYAGINTILAPVLDINTNPENPIIATRAFGEDRETVSFFGCEMIKTLRESGIASCGKHFPGHGDTAVDSHIKLPVVNRPFAELVKAELVPFRAAVTCGVDMVMLGHLSVPAIDASGIPVSLSGKAVSYLRRKLRFSGILITDAMNMGGLAGFSEEEASFRALDAGVDIILHPSQTEKVIKHLRRKALSFDDSRLVKFRMNVSSASSSRPDFNRNLLFSERLTQKAIKVSSDFRIRERPVLVILNDEEGFRGKLFAKKMREHIPGLVTRVISPGSKDVSMEKRESFVIVSIFSDVRGWKGGASDWLHRQIESLSTGADLLVSFGSPYLIRDFDLPKIYVYWDSAQAQSAAALEIKKRYLKRSSL